MCANQIEISCPLHEEVHEVYQGYRECAFVQAKVDFLAKTYEEEPVHIISTGKVLQAVRGEMLGLKQGVLY